MENAALRIAAASVLLVLGGCSGTPATPAQVSTASAPATTQPSSASAPASSAPAPADGQEFQIAKMGIQMTVPADFVVVDATKTDDAYWEDLGEMAGVKAATLKGVAKARDGVAVGPGKIMISVGSPRETMPSLAEVKKDMKDRKLTGTAEEVETGLGAGIMASVQAGATFQKAVYVQGPDSVVVVNFSSPDIDMPGAVFRKVAPTLKAL